MTIWLEQKSDPSNVLTKTELCHFLVYHVQKKKQARTGYVGLEGQYMYNNNYNKVAFACVVSHLF